MTLYAFISSGLRGCYMPDSAQMQQFKTRRELRQYVESEAQYMREAYGYGGDKKTIQSVCAYAWRSRKKGWGYNLAIPFGRTRSKTDRPFGLFIGHATRREYLEFVKSERDY
jgi:hypothetical protein